MIKPISPAPTTPSSRCHQLLVAMRSPSAGGRYSSAANPATGQNNNPLYFAAIVKPPNMPASSRSYQRPSSSQHQSRHAASTNSAVNGRSVEMMRLLASRLGSKAASTNTSHPPAAPNSRRPQKKSPSSSSTPSTVIPTRACSSIPCGSAFACHKNTSEKSYRLPCSHSGLSSGRLMSPRSSSGSPAIIPASGGCVVASRKSPVRR